MNKRAEDLVPKKAKRAQRSPVPNKDGWELYIDFITQLRALNMSDEEWAILTHQILDDISSEEKYIRNYRVDNYRVDNRGRNRT